MFVFSFEPVFVSFPILIYCSRFLTVEQSFFSILHPKFVDPMSKGTRLVSVVGWYNIHTLGHHIYPLTIYRKTCNSKRHTLASTIFYSHNHSSLGSSPQRVSCFDQSNHHGLVFFLVGFFNLLQFFVSLCTSFFKFGCFISTPI